MSYAQTSVAGAPSPGVSRTIIIASEWHFLPAGVAEIHRRAKKACEEAKIEDVRGDWFESDQTFRFICQPGHVEVVSRLFIQIFDRIIKKELSTSIEADAGYEEGDTYVDFDEDTELISDKVQRLEDWLAEHPATLQSEPDTRHIIRPDNHEADASPLNELIAASALHILWNNNDSSFLKKSGLARVLAELQSMTECNFHVVSSGIHIGGLSQENVDVACTKLSNIYQYQNPSFATHLFNSEGVEKVEYVMQYAVHVPKYYFRTTMLDNEHVRMNEQRSNYENLKSAVVVRCCDWSSVHVGYVLCKPNKLNKIQATLSGLRDIWAQGFIPRGNGELEPWKSAQKLEFDIMPEAHRSSGSVHSAVHSSTPAPDVVNQGATMSWVKQTQPDPDLQFREVHGSNPPPGVLTKNGVAEAGKPAAPPRPAWDTHVEPDVNVYLQPLTLQQKMTSAASRIALDRGQVSPLPQIPKGMVQTSQRNPLDTDRASPEKLLMKPLSPARAPAWTGRKVDSTAENDPFPKLPSPPKSQGSGHMQAYAASTETPPHSQSFRAVGLMDDDAPSISFRTLEPTHSLLSSTRTLTPDTLVNSEASGSETVASASRDSFPLPKLQQTSEIARRVFHNTMNKKAPKPSPQKKSKRPQTKDLQTKGQFADRLGYEPVLTQAKEGIQDVQHHSMLPALVGSLDKAFLSMMEKMRGVRGEIVVQAEIGRIFLNNLNDKDSKILGVTRSEKGEVVDGWNSSDLEPILNSIARTTLNTYFTKVVMVSGSECQSLIDMKDANGDASWSIRSPLEGTYRFYFIDKSKQARFIIEIDCQNFKTEARVHRVWGAINVHGTRRHWDFRISASGFPTNVLLSERHEKLVRKLSESLFVPQKRDMAAPEFYFELDDALHARYKLEELQVRRTLQYGGTVEVGTGIVLKVTEIQSLLVKHKALMSRGSMIFQAVPDESDIPVSKKLRTWHEITITSDSITQHVKENSKLQLGDVASWSAADLVPFARDLYLPACELLAKMDAVGQANDNGADATLPPREAPPAPVVQFW